MTLGWLHRSEAQAALAPRPGSRATKAVLIACPVVFTCFVGIYSRSYNDGFQVPSGTPAQDAVAFAYAPYVNQTNALFGSGTTPKDRSAMLNLATKWDSAVQHDQLQPLVPVSFEDNPEEGPRASIMKAKATLVSGLLDDATNQAQNGHAHAASSEALLATRLSESLKYSDFTSVHVAAFEEERAAAILSKVSKHLSPDDKAHIRDGLQLIKSNSGELATMTRFSRVQYYDYQRRMSKTPVSIEDVHRTVLFTKRVTSDPSSRDTLNFVRNSLIDSTNDDGSEYL